MSSEHVHSSEDAKAASEVGLRQVVGDPNARMGEICAHHWPSSRALEGQPEKTGRARLFG
jgi:hypothetical protein